MTRIASARMPSQGLAFLKVMRTRAEGADGGWQDKSRKVRPVGCEKSCFSFNHPMQLANVERTFSVLPNCSRGSTFCTLPTNDGR